MIPPFSSEFLAPTKRFRRLSVLLAIHDSSQISQHKIARIAHLSSSMVNNYIKELHERRLIKIAGRTNRTQRYYLTPSGRELLISSLLSYSSEIIRLYGGAKRQLSKRLQRIHEEGIRTVALFGAAETAEVVLAAIKETPLTVAAVMDSDSAKQGKPLNGLTVQKPESLSQMEVDAVVITSFGRQEEIHDDVRKLVGKEMKVVRLSDL
jgi:predicted transcriptional regulator